MRDSLKQAQEDWEKQALLLRMLEDRFRQAESDNAELWAQVWETRQIEVAAFEKFKAARAAVGKGL